MSRADVQIASVVRADGDRLTVRLVRGGSEQLVEIAIELPTMDGYRLRRRILAGVDEIDALIGALTAARDLGRQEPRR